MKCPVSLFPLFRDQVVFLACYRPRSGGDNVLGSVRPPVRPSVSPLAAEPFIRPWCLSVCRVITRMRSISFQWSKILVTGLTYLPAGWFPFYLSLLGGHSHRSEVPAGQYLHLQGFVRSHKQDEVMTCPHGPHHEKRSLKSFVVVIPKEGWYAWVPKVLRFAARTGTPLTGP